MPQKNIITFGVILLLIVLMFFLFYHNNELTIIGIKESNKSYIVEVLESETITESTLVKIHEKECKIYPHLSSHVTIPYVDHWDFFLKISGERGKCIITNSSSTGFFEMNITNLAEIILTYPILIEYFSILDCDQYWLRVYDKEYYTIGEYTLYGSYTINPKENYNQKLTYDQIHQLQPYSEEKLTAFRIIIGAPESCQVVEKTKSVPKNRTIKKAIERTMYNYTIASENLIFNLSFFQKIIKKDKVLAELCESKDYGVKDGTCYLKIQN